MRTYRAVYRSPTGNEIVIKSLRRPPKSKSFRTAVGTRKHSLVKLQSSLREVIIVASTKNRKRAVEQEELEESEAIEDLEAEIEELEDFEEEEEVEEEEDEDEEEEPEDEVEDEEEEDEEEDEDEEEEEEAPRRAARTRKGTSTKAKSTPKKTQSRAAADGKVGSAEVAEHFGIDSRSLRMLLRKNNIPVDPDSNRYEWRSLTSPQVVKIGKLISAGEHKKIQRESLDKMRAKKAAAKPQAKPVTKKPVAKKTATKTTATKTRRKRVVEEDED
jgi:hypothetical protein